MGFFESVSDVLSAAAPWETSEAEAVTRGGTGTGSTPAQQDGGDDEGEVIVSTGHDSLCGVELHA
jgi:hypothetical protein